MSDNNSPAFLLVPPASGLPINPTLETMSTYISVAHQRRVTTPLTLADFQKITQFPSPAAYVAYLDQLAADNAASGMECTADDYRTMASLVNSLVVS